MFSGKAHILKKSTDTEYEVMKLISMQRTDLAVELRENLDNTGDLSGVRVSTKVNRDYYRNKRGSGQDRKTDRNLYHN